MRPPLLPLPGHLEGAQMFHIGIGIFLCLIQNQNLGMGSGILRVLLLLGV